MTFFATLIVPVDGGVGDRKRSQDNKKGDSKGSGRADGSANNKDGTTGASAGTKSKDAGEGGKRLVSHC